MTPYDDNLVPDMVNAPPAFDFQKRALAIEQRKARLAALMKQQMPGQAPQGKMVSGHYVAPSAFEQLAAVAQPLAAQYGASQEQKGLEKDTAELEAADRAASLAHAQSAPQGRPEQAGPPLEGGSPELAAQPATPQQKIAWAEQGLQIPSRKALLTKLIEDQTIQEPVRAEARTEKRLTREDNQVEARNKLAAEQKLAYDQLAQRAEDARQRSADTNRSVDERREASQRHDALMLQLGQMRLDAANSKAGQGKTLPQGVIKDLGGLEDNVGRISALKGEFKDDFGGLKGAAATIAGNNIPGVTTDASEWWRNYKKESQLTERHAMFGASLTPGEQTEWRAADIHPGMDPEAIKRNLIRREALSRKVFDNAVDRFHKAGYNAHEAFGEPRPLLPTPQTASSGPVTAAPVRVNSVAEAMKLPPGTKFIDPNGVQRTR